jgi:hypothetical protein
VHTLRRFETLSGYTHGNISKAKKKKDISGEYTTSPTKKHLLLCRGVYIIASFGQDNDNETGTFPVLVDDKLSSSLKLRRDITLAVLP